MARIAGVDLPKNKRGIIGLTYILWDWPYLSYWKDLWKKLGLTTAISGSNDWDGQRRCKYSSHHW